MSRRQITGLFLALVLLLATWGACTASTAKELADKLSKMQAEKERVATEMETLKAATYKLQIVAKDLLADYEEMAAELELAKKLVKLPRIENCTVSHYCTERYPHICGSGNGITASGEPVQAGVSCAVDPFFIPLGSTVYVDYGDGVIHTYIAHDTGSAVNGAHIDVAVDTHVHANELGMKTATVWWE